jgi:hypothetical protein
MAAKRTTEGAKISMIRGMSKLTFGDTNETAITPDIGRIDRTTAAHILDDNTLFLPFQAEIIATVMSDR